MVFGRVSRGVVLVGAGSLGIVSVLGFFAPVFWGFGLLEHFRVQYVIAALVGGGLAFAFRQKWSAVVFLGIVGLNGWIVSDVFVPNPNDAEKRDGDLRLVSYNVWRRGGDVESIHRCLDFYQPDVAYLSEMDVEKATSISGIFRRYGEGSDILLVREGSGVEVLEAIPSPENLGAGLVAHLSHHGEKFCLLAVHLPTPLGAENVVERERIFEAIFEWLSEQDEPCVLVGDFNATPWSFPFQKFRRETGLQNSQRGYGLQTTWPTHPPKPWRQALLIPIDHLIHSSSVIITDRKVGMAGNSNHRALFVQFRIEPHVM